MSKIEITEFENLLVFKQNYKIDYIKELIVKKKIEGIRVFIAFDEDKLESLDLLREFIFLEKLEIATYYDYDLSFLKNLKLLKRLSVEQEGHNIDLSNLGLLKELILKWRKNIQGLEKLLNLEYLCLIEFKEKDLKPIKELLNLEKLVIKTSSITNIEGVQNFRNLQSVQLGNCKKLTTIDSLANLENLKELELNTCSKLDDISCLSQLSALEKLVLGNCSEIKSLKFLDSMKSLKHVEIWGNTKIVDRDLTPMKRFG